MSMFAAPVAAPAQVLPQTTRSSDGNMLHLYNTRNTAPFIPLTKIKHTRVVRLSWNLRIGG